MNHFKVHHLWPIPVYESKIKTKQEWIDFIVNLEYKRTNIGNSDISKNRYILKEMPDLKKEIDKHCNLYIRKYLNIKEQIKFYMTNSWINIHQPNDEAQIHHHSNAMLSGVYYPYVAENSGNIQFHRSNHKNLFDHCMMMEYDKQSMIVSDRYQLDTVQDMIIIFPSHLEHSVIKNISNANRYSLAFNYFCRGKFGKEEYQLEIK